MEINSFKKYWAGPWGTAGPWPQLAHADRAKGERGGLAGPRPTAAFGLASLAGEGRVPRRGARWRGGAARPAAGGHLRPRQRKQASAGGVRGNGESEQAAKHG